MPIKEYGVKEEEIEVLHSGKIFWERIVADREGKHNEFKERDNDIVI